MKCELSNCAPGTAASGLESKSPFRRPAWWVLSSGKPTRLPAGKNSWKRRPWSRWLSGLTWNRLLGQWRNVTAAASTCNCRDATCSPPDSPANRTAKPESAPGTEMSGGFGQQFGAPLAYWDRATCSWKTSQACLLTELSESYSETWPRSGSMRNGTLYQRRTQARITSASGYSSSRGATMPTPDAGSNRSRSGPNAHNGKGLLDACREMMPTPNASPAGPDYARAGRAGSGGDDLATGAARMQPTPCASDSDGQSWDLYARLANVGRQKMQPTPRAEDSQAAGAHRGNPDTLLSHARAMMQSPTASDALGSRSTKGRKRQAEGGLRREMLRTPTTRDHHPQGTTATAKQKQASKISWDGTGTKGPNGSGRPNKLGWVAAEMLATPSASDYRSGAGYIHEGKTQTPQPRHQSGGMLNPRPVEWMMGLPKNWVLTGGMVAHTHQTNGSPAANPTGPSNSTRSEMESYLSKQRSRLRSLLAGLEWRGAWGLSE